MNAVGACGLQLYNFGQTVSMVFFTDNWRPSSFYDRVKENRDIGLHTLMLLDIKVKEQSLENMARGRKIYEPPRYMTVAQCAEQMIEIEEDRKENGKITPPLLFLREISFFPIVDNFQVIPRHIIPLMVFMLTLHY